MKHKDIARRSRNQSPHPALSLGFALSGSRFARATFSQREKDTPAECSSPSGRGCREAAGEGSENFVKKTRSYAIVIQRKAARNNSLMRPFFVSLWFLIMSPYFRTPVLSFQIGHSRFEIPRFGKSVRFVTSLRVSPGTSSLRRCWWWHVL